MTEALKRHWPEYLMEATCLGLFMVSAFTFGTILEHPASPVHLWVYFTAPLLGMFLAAEVYVRTRGLRRCIFFLSSRI